VLLCVRACVFVCECAVCVCVQCVRLCVCARMCVHVCVYVMCVCSCIAESVAGFGQRRSLYVTDTRKWRP
jgi:hypothetical protein